MSFSVVPMLGNMFLVITGVSVLLLALLSYFYAENSLVEKLATVVCVVTIVCGVALMSSSVTLDEAQLSILLLVAAASGMFQCKKETSRITKPQLFVCATLVIALAAAAKMLPIYTGS